MPLTFPKPKVVKSATIKDTDFVAQKLAEVLEGASDFFNQSSVFNPNVETTQITNNATGAYISPIITLTGTTPTINQASGNNKIFEITLSGSTTYSIVNTTIGGVFIVRVKQGSGTTYTNTWFSTITWITSGGTALVQTTVSNGITTYGFICRGVGIFDGYKVGGQ